MSKSLVPKNVTTSASINETGVATVTIVRPTGLPLTQPFTAKVALYEKDNLTPLKIIETSDAAVNFEKLSIGKDYITVVQTSIGQGKYSLPVSSAFKLQAPSLSPWINDITTRVVDNQINVLIQYTQPKIKTGFPSFIQSYTATATPTSPYITESIPPVVTMETKNSPASLLGLIEGQGYTFDIKANTVSGSSQKSTGLFHKSIDSSLPPSSLEITPSLTTKGEVTFSWSQTGYPTGYLIQVFNATTLFYSNTVTVTNRSIVIQGLNIGINYTFTVYSYSIFGNSLVYSSSASTSFTLNVPFPNPNLDATVQDTSSVILVWLKPKSLGQPEEFKSYNISTYLSKNPKTSIRDVSFNDIETLTTTITNLTPGTQYFFTINTANTSGNSLPIQSSTVTTYKVPDPPTDIIVDPSFDLRGAVQLNWLPPFYTGNPSFTGFNVYYDTVPIDKNTMTPIFSDSDYQETIDGKNITRYYCDISNLDIGTRYNYLINTVNEYGVSLDFSSTFELAVPGPPSFNLKILFSTTYNSATFSYFQPVLSGNPDNITYTVDISGIDISYNITNNLPSIDIPEQYTVNDLSADTDYIFNLTAINTSGSSLPVSTTTLRTQTSQ
jgi:predicted phage tail protein